MKTSIDGLTMSGLGLKTMDEEDNDYPEGLAFLNTWDTERSYIGTQAPMIAKHTMTPQERLEAIQERQTWREADRDTRLDIDWE